MALRCFPPPERPGAARWTRRAWLLGTAALPLLGGSVAARAAGVDLAALRARRDDSGVQLDYQVRLSLDGPPLEALRRGVPLYFVAQATLLRERWYWRDERVSRAARSWRVAWQPLTSSWRVSLGNLGQTHASLEEALAQLTRVAGWTIAEPDRLEAGSRYRVDFRFYLDDQQLPPPMQVTLGGDWTLQLDRSVRVE